MNIDAMKDRTTLNRVLSTFPKARYQHPASGHHSFEVRRPFHSLSLTDLQYWVSTSLQKKTVVKLCFTAPPQATYDMGPMADEEFVAAHAVKVNVFHTIDYLLQYSD